MATTPSESPDAKRAAAREQRRINGTTANPNSTPVRDSSPQANPNSTPGTRGVQRWTIADRQSNDTAQMQAEANRNGAFGTRAQNLQGRRDLFQKMAGAGGNLDQFKGQAAALGVTPGGWANAVSKLGMQAPAITPPASAAPAPQPPPVAGPAATGQAPPPPVAGVTPAQAILSTQAVRNPNPVTRAAAIPAAQPGSMLRPAAPAPSWQQMASPAPAPAPPPVAAAPSPAPAVALPQPAQPTAAKAKPKAVIQSNPPTISHAGAGATGFSFPEKMSKRYKAEEKKGYKTPLRSATLAAGTGAKALWSDLAAGFKS